MRPIADLYPSEGKIGVRDATIVADVAQQRLRIRCVTTCRADTSASPDSEGPVIAQFRRPHWAASTSTRTRRRRPHADLTSRESRVCVTIRQLIQMRGLRS